MTFSAACLTALLLTLPGLEAALVLTQEKSFSVNVGGNVRIPCTESGSSSTYTLSWYQQKPGGVPTFLLVTGSTRANGLPSRFTSSGTSSDKTEYLLINGVQAEDEATYYCSCGGCGADSGFGGGTEVIIAQPPSPPSLVLMGPTQSSLPGASVSLVCLASGYRPSDATLTWYEDGGSVTGSEVQTSPSQRQPDGTYTISSFLTLASTRWNSGHSFTCQVSHSALSSPLMKSISNQCSP
ncbi:immunoglobulin kappa light chain-like isoform X2 [Lampris incognitus]|uniref:immunoglobulin kappa light chain-like isoform X2 n=1 Tax=Lampris incognitus TaxID=2546036 RepID=UPI0024B4B4B7|nr:immunoglobulin kappa light chain-like isoform X2 [Lampris incognitus]